MSLLRTQQRFTAYLNRNNTECIMCLNEILHSAESSTTEEKCEGDQSKDL